MNTCHELEKGTRAWKLNFSSACRDRDVWPTSAEWRTTLSTTMRNVSRISLRSVALHAAEYTVDTWNCYIDVSIGVTVYQVKVPVGMYTPGSLATAVTSAMVATDVALAGFSATYTSVTDTMTISESTPTPFTILWLSGPNANTSLRATLGYSLVDSVSTLVGGSHDAVSPGRVDMDGVLTIDVFADELTNSMDGPIGRVLLERAVDGAPVFQETVLDDQHTFWPIGKVQFLTFRFMVQYGRVNADGTILCDYRPYNFNGKDVTLVLGFGVTSYLNPLEDEVQLDHGT